MRKGGLYLAFGDSWTWAINTSTTKGDHFYANKVRNSIRSEFGICRLINKGIGGSTSGEAVLNIPWITDIEPDLVTIGLGMNDSPDGIIPINIYKDNMRKLVDAVRMRNPNADIVLCTVGRTLDPARVPYVQAYRDALAEVATEKSTKLCRFENAWTSAQDSTHLEADLVHPTALGQQALHNILYPIVKTGDWLRELDK